MSVATEERYGYQYPKTREVSAPTGAPFRTKDNQWVMTTILKIEEQWPVLCNVCLLYTSLFNVTEEQQSLVELIRDFMTKEIKPHVLEWEKEGHYPQEIIEQGIEMGLHMLQVPEEYGGKMCIRDSLWS